jgi:hypothetical protein
MVVTGCAFALTINALLARFVRDVGIIARDVEKRQTNALNAHNRPQDAQHHTRYYRNSNNVRTPQRQPRLGYW